MRNLGDLLIVLGATAVLLGIAIRYAPGSFSWFGRLPGDIRVEGERTRLHVPVTSMILLSIGLTLLINFVVRLRR